MSKINHLHVRITMIRKGIKPSRLQKKFKVSRSAISRALSGDRHALLQKISRYVKNAA